MKKNVTYIYHMFMWALAAALCLAPAGARGVQAGETAAAETEPAGDAAAEVRVIPYAEALEMALANLTSLMEIDDNLLVLKEERDEFEEEWDDVRRNTYIPKIEKDEMENSFNAMNKNIEAVEINREMIPLSIEISLMNALVNVDNYERDIQLMEATVLLNEDDLRRTQIKKQYGMAAEADVRAAEQTLALNRSQLDSLLISLETERQSLNKTLQLPLSASVRVEYERTWEEPLADRDAYIAERCESDPTVRQKQLAVDIKKGDLDLNNQKKKEDRTRRKEDKDKVDTFQQAYDQAVRELDDAKAALEAAIRTGYNRLDVLIKQDETWLIDLEKAIDQRDTLLVRLKAGQVTQYDVDNAALAITQNEISIEKNKNSYWTLRFMLEHPFLLG